ncbi:MAG: ParA family protein [Candidatus Magnetomorum sp.]|nr:ParA family protein [Candidatus Magnetomorum sp.]
MRRVVFNQKGGVGKTTITCNLAAICAFHGKKTLVIDLDPQSNSSQYLLGDRCFSMEQTSLDYFTTMLSFNLFGSDPNDLPKFIHETPFENLDIIPSHPDLDDLQSKLEARYKMFKLKKSLDMLSGYDFIFIDTPPALNFYSRSALIASDSCLIPFDCDHFSRNALYRLLNSVAEIRFDHNTELEIEGIVVNQFQARARLPKVIVNELIDEGLPVLNPFISYSIRIRESHDESKPMIFFDPNHKITEEYLQLYTKLK